jgi:hypothetical protein
MEGSQHLRACARAAFWVGIGLCSAAHADIVTTVDGARLTGSIVKITPKAVELTTTYAGTLTVAMDQVASVTSDAALTTQLTDSTTVTGVTVIDQQKISVTGPSIAETATLGQLQASWLPDAPPPAESLFDPRHWVYRVGADIAGKSGNSDMMTTNVRFNMALVSKLDELRFYGSYQRAE